MIKALSLAAALALLPLSTALAQDAGQDRAGAAEAALEAAAEAFEARMEEFGERAEQIEGDASLTEAQQGAAIAALWAEYQPAVNEFTAFATQQAGAIAAEAMADIDMDALVADAMASVDLSGLTTMAENGAWASNDPEHIATYGLMADYALGELADELEAVEIEIDLGDVEADMAQLEADMAQLEAEMAVEATAPEAGEDD